ncbi:MAG: hypothetical protein AAF409_01580 [Pseudomonadota bacterium]
MNPPIEVEGTRSVAVAVEDVRPYVATGDKSPSFVGLQRAGFGIPHNVSTTSGQAMVSDMTGALVRALQEKGFDASPLPTQPGSALAAVSPTSDRTLVVSLREWKSDVYAQVTLSWNMDVTVFDSSGQQLATVSDRGVEGVGSGVFEADNANLAVGMAGRKFANLLNMPEVQSALR